MALTQVKKRADSPLELSWYQPLAGISHNALVCTSVSYNQGALWDIPAKGLKLTNCSAWLTLTFIYMFEHHGPYSKKWNSFSSTLIPGISLTSQTWLFRAMFCKLAPSEKHWILWRAVIDSLQSYSLIFLKLKTSKNKQSYLSDFFLEWWWTEVIPF